MILKDYKRYARWVLCAAILFVAGNAVHALEHAEHALEHDVGTDLSQSHSECNHCSDKHSAVIAQAPTSSLQSLLVEHPVLVVPTFVVALTATFQARAPPLS